jgi:hypothetical protein
MRKVIFIAALMLAACNEPATQSEVEPSEDATVERSSASSNVLGDCEALSIDEALSAKAELENIGLFGAWNVYGDETLSCDAAEDEGRVTCELQDGGVAVLEYAPEVIGFANRSGEPVSAVITVDGVECARLSAGNAEGE